MNHAAATQLVIAAIAAEFRLPPGRIGAATEWRDVPGWNSIAQVLLVLRLEDLLEQAGAAVPGGDALQGCFSVASLAAAIGAA